MTRGGELGGKPSRCWQSFLTKVVYTSWVFSYSYLCSVTFQATMQSVHAVLEIVKKLQDSDEDVRAEVVQAILTFSTHGRVMNSLLVIQDWHLLQIPLQMRSNYLSLWLSNNWMMQTGRFGSKPFRSWQSYPVMVRLPIRSTLVLIISLPSRFWRDIPNGYGRTCCKAHG